MHRSFQERERCKEEAISKILQKTAQEKAAGACRLLKFCMKSTSSLFLTIQSKRLRVPVNPLCMVYYESKEYCVGKGKVVLGVLDSLSEVRRAGKSVRSDRIRKRRGLKESLG